MSGWLTCRREGDWIAMDFPAVQAVECAAPEGLSSALGGEVRWCGANGMDYLVEVADEAWMRQMMTMRGQLTGALAQISRVKVTEIHFEMKRNGGR